MRQILITDEQSTAEYGRRDPSRIDHISIHHWAGPELGVEDAHKEYERLLQIRDFHRYSNQWPGYAYHFTIFPSGRIYYTGNIATLRYVVKRKNGESLAIALAGNFMTHPPTEMAIRSAVRLIGELNFELDFLRRFGSWIPILGHKEVVGTDPTACPGNTWPEWKDALLLPPPNTPDPGSGFDDGTMQGRNIQRAVNNANRWEVPPEYPLACAIAEAALLDSWRRPENPADDARYWPDVSEGCLQQTVAWSDEYQEEGGDPWTYPGPEATERILALYRNPDHAFSKAMPQLRQKWDETGGNVLDSLCLYNAPAIDPANNPNRSNYANGLAAARRILAGEHWRSVVGER